MPDDNNLPNTQGPQAINPLPDETSVKAGVQDNPVVPPTVPPQPPIPEPVVPTFPSETDFPPPPPPAGVPEASDLPPIISPPAKKFRGKKMVATILGVLLLVGSLGAGIILVKQQQDIREKAEGITETINCITNPGDKGCCPQAEACPYQKDKNLLRNCHPPEGDGTPQDSLCNEAGRREQCGPGRPWFCCPKANGEWTKDMSKCPTPTPTPTASPGPVSCNESCSATVPCSGSLICYKSGDSSTGACRNPNCLQKTNCVCGTPSPTPTPAGCNKNCNLSINPQITCEEGLVCRSSSGATPISGAAGVCRNPDCPGRTSCICPTPTPSYPPGQLGRCVGIKAYDFNWNPLALDTAAIKIGDKINFAVKGEEGPGKYDQARFMVNGIEKPEWLTDKPHGTEGFYITYTILKTDVGKSISVKAKIHNTVLGWSNY